MIKLLIKPPIKPPAKPPSLVRFTSMAYHSLLVLMLILSFLMSLTIGSWLLVNRTLSSWIGNSVNEATVEIRPSPGVDLSMEVSKALVILSNTSGVISSEAISFEKTADLLRPWLGETDIINELPLPALIAVVFSADFAVDFDSLSERLAVEVKGASLDTHNRWQFELIGFSDLLENTSFAVLILIILVIIIVVIFATRAVMTESRETVEVLSLVGARHRFIITEVVSVFFRLCLPTSFIGLVPSIILFFVLSHYYGSIGSFFIHFSALEFSDYLIIALSLPVINLITVLTAAMTTYGILSKGDN